MEVSPELLMTLARCLGWTLLHSLWQGTLIAGLLAMLLRAWRHRSAALRHVACLLAMFTLAGSALLTAWQLWPESRTHVAAPVTVPALVTNPFAEPAPVLAPSGNQALPASAALPAEERVSSPSHSWRERVEPLLPWLTAAWILGLLIRSARLCGGWWMLRSLRSRGVAVRAEWKQIADRLAARLDLRPAARLLETLEAATPMVAGLIWPVVLLPARVMTGLTAGQLEAILAHELAHLARRDLWGHAAQLAVETCFFYHPAVWWMGRRASCEREHAADDLALAICADRRTYAEALARVAELQLVPPLALAATGSDLLARIRRIVLPASAQPAGGGWSLGLPVLVTVLMAGSLLVARAADEKVITVAPGKSIQAAIDAAPAGAIIRLAEGEYRERIVIAKPLTLEGAGWEKSRLVIEEPPGEELKTALQSLLAQREAAVTAEEIERVAKEWTQRVVRPAIWVRDTQEVKLRNLRLQGMSQRGRDDGGTNSALLCFQNARATVTACAVFGPFGNGIQIGNSSEVEIRQSLVAALWGNGIVVFGTGRDGASIPGRLHLVESEVRNIYHYGVAIGPGADSTVVERCRISGTAWHGIRYDDASPTIIGNTIFANARLGIYASGKTKATVRGNLLWKNEMEGMWCLEGSSDLIEDNTFVGNLRGALQISGEGKPRAVRNIFANNPVGVGCSQAQSNSGLSAVGDLTMEANLFYENPIAWQVKGETKLPPAGNEKVDPKFRDAAKEDFSLAEDSPARVAGTGAMDPLPPNGPWVLLAEEKAIVPSGATREYLYWTAPGSAKSSKTTSDLYYAARDQAATIVADAFQLQDAAKREVAIARIRAAVESSQLSEIRVGLAAFAQVEKVAFDKETFRPALRKLLASPETDIRTRALTALAVAGPNREDLDRALAMTNDPSGDVVNALPRALKLLSPDGFTGKTGEAVLQLLDRPDAKATDAVWRAMWGTAISPELEKRVVEASRKDDKGYGYSVVFYHALTTHLSKREPTVTRLIELSASVDTTNVAGRCLWGLLQGVVPEQQPRVVELAKQIIAARSDDYLRRQAQQCIRAYDKSAAQPTQ